MASAPSADDELFDEFLSDRGHEISETRWEYSYNKKQCPECGGLNDESSTECSVCGWRPGAA
ncbi:small CPxCG-related zinc finger protein [Halalkaliarchaeum desulfuricum]|uniref:Small CPxCG-related zinc finger protein n=1 Tax=Halalkaliarchaeum desulfuricum TaxID=2055893 RepID=A0A343THW1_9EURY|nr:HVO_0416 family zinc finger protein [Halalkaliarchaeum desulfuricum]AUX08683.1 small CPxCG-related zinc finger protein [Halalkaliarchaeum desulfuricum]